MMEKQINNSKKKQRTKVKDLPKDEKQLTPEEQKRIKGGLGSALGAGGNFGDTPGLNGGDMVSKKG